MHGGVWLPPESTASWSTLAAPTLCTLLQPPPPHTSAGAAAVTIGTTPPGTDVTTPGVTIATPTPVTGQNGDLGDGSSPRYTTIPTTTAVTGGGTTAPPQAGAGTTPPSGGADDLPSRGRLIGCGSAICMEGECAVMDEDGCEVCVHC